VGALVSICCTLTEVLLNLIEVFLTLTEVFQCFFLSCKANASRDKKADVKWIYFDFSLLGRNEHQYFKAQRS
jgi:competence protein ComGF